ncbi:MAG TPA: hypothetical protein VK783_01195 [Bacteroidia bacterium]|nr:hypothetical protein [Bacteroidia bacterium]
MKRFWFKIEDDILGPVREITEVPAGFIECDNTFGPDAIYYKIEGTVITEVISEAMHEEKARERAEDFVSRLNVNVF